MEDHILSRFLKEGDRLDIRAMELLPGERFPKEYSSKLQVIVSNDTVDILMPMERGRLVRSPIGTSYELVFYNKTGMYQCVARVVDSFQTKKLALLRMEFTSNLRKYQRREYYRHSCALEMRARPLQEQELQALQEHKEIEFLAGQPLIPSIVVDISGGGLRFVSSQIYEPGSLIYCCYQLLFADKTKKVEVIGKVLSASPMENRRGMYEHRVQYYNIQEKLREEIIRFIFAEERRIAKFDR